jgi:hypothetical protein
MKILIYKGYPIRIDNQAGDIMVNDPVLGNFTVTSDSGLVFIANVEEFGTIYGSSQEEVTLGAYQMIDRYLDKNN